MNNRKLFFLGLLALFPVLIWAELYMVVEYNTNGTVKRNIFNITM